jgi:hypothetical protein
MRLRSEPPSSPQVPAKGPGAPIFVAAGARSSWPPSVRQRQGNILCTRYCRSFVRCTSYSALGSSEVSVKTR